MKSGALVTAGNNPDLDGVACAYSYAELLNNTGKPAIACIFGTPSVETQYIMQRYAISPLAQGETTAKKLKDVIMVDASTIAALPQVEPSKIIEIIDHRKIHDAKDFPNASIQIELVGAAATLIAEKYQHCKILPSREAAALMYFAIVSNTINFHAEVATKRDMLMSDWLKSLYPFEPEAIHGMFLAKSKLTQPIKEAFLQEYYPRNVNGKKITIFQLELIDVEGFIKKNLKEIKNGLEEIKREESLDIVFLSCIDVENFYNEFVAVDEESKALLSKVLGLKFSQGLGHRDGVIMRKEIVPLIVDALEKVK